MPKDTEAGRGLWWGWEGQQGQSLKPFEGTYCDSYADDELTILRYGTMTERS